MSRAYQNTSVQADTFVSEPEERIGQNRRIVSVESEISGSSQMLDDLLNETRRILRRQRETLRLGGASERVSDVAY